jgi:hypothetical protein
VYLPRSRSIELSAHKVCFEYVGVSIRTQGRVPIRSMVQGFLSLYVPMIGNSGY